MEYFIILLTLVPYLIPLLLIFLGFQIGRNIEKRHYRELEEREARLETPVITTKTPPEGDIAYARLVMGSVVLSFDRFKQVAFNFRNMIGGEVTGYSSLIERARREAILRVKETSPNADVFVNLRFETSTISSGGKKQVGSVEVLAYATAIKYKNGLSG